MKDEYWAPQQKEQERKCMGGKRDPAALGCDRKYISPCTEEGCVLWQ